jgi:hypothetical protein
LKLELKQRAFRKAFESQQRVEQYFNSQAHSTTVNMSVPHRKKETAVKATLVKNVEGIFLPLKTQRRLLTKFIKQQISAENKRSAMNFFRWPPLPISRNSVPELQSWDQLT